MKNMKELLEHLYKGASLTQQEAEDVLSKIGQNRYSDIEISSFLTVYLMREITPEELAGFRNALMQLCVKVDLNGYDTIDVCGTGGDGKNTFNISTISAFVLAGTGIRVAKHGNYGVSGPVGSSNIFEQVGYRFSTDPGRLKHEVEEAGITFMHAPLFHPAMKYVAPVRRALKIRTFFNMLGPMINPASPKYQLVGVYSPEVQELYSEVYRKSERRYIIVHALDGYDEISLTGKTRVVSNSMEETIDPSTFGFTPVDRQDLSGGTNATEALTIFMNVLNNQGTKQQKNTALANSAAGIRCVFPEKSWSDCVETARESLESGKAIDSFRKLLSLQQ
jgi:anthranilate phosphoribosyltransferase